jgi:hypothetical protein
LGQFYLKPIGLTDEGSGEDGDVEDDTHEVKDRESEDELEKRQLEVQSGGQDDVDGDDVA